MARKKISIFVFSYFVFSFFLINSASAHHREKVLGVATESSNLQIPPTVEGPGFLLPDNPFYFIDGWKQRARVFFAFTPETKAKVYTNIAGERLAELRLMLARKDSKGIRSTMAGVSDNLQKAVDEVDQAKLLGKDVTSLAKSINTSIKIKQESLDVLENQSSGEIEGLVQAVQNSLDESKVKIEDHLPYPQIQNEIRDSLERKIKKRVTNASESSKIVEREIEELQKEASVSARDSLKNREEELKRAIQEKNEVLKRQIERDLETEKKKQEALLKIHKKAAEEAKQAMESARNTALEYQKADKLRNQ